MIASGGRASMSTGICSLLMERSRIKMTIVPAPGKLPADGGGWSFSGTRGEGRTERGDGFPPFRLEKIKKREQKRRLRCPLMLETGMRPEEVYRIQPENVNLTGGYLFNPHGKTKGHPSAGSADHGCPWSPAQAYGWTGRLPSSSRARRTTPDPCPR
jgi:hypothetical protein